MAMFDVGSVVEVEFDGDWYSAVVQAIVPAGVRVCFDVDQSITVVSEAELAYRIKGNPAAPTATTEGVAKRRRRPVSHYIPPSDSATQSSPMKREKKDSSSSSSISLERPTKRGREHAKQSQTTPDQLLQSKGEDNGRSGTGNQRQPRKPHKANERQKLPVAKKKAKTQAAIAPVKQYQLALAPDDWITLIQALADGNPDPFQQRSERDEEENSEQSKATEGHTTTTAAALSSSLPTPHLTMPVDPVAPSGIADIDRDIADFHGKKILFGHITDFLEVPSAEMEDENVKCWRVEWKDGRRDSRQIDRIEIHRMLRFAKVLQFEEERGNIKACDVCGVVFQSLLGFQYHAKNQVCVRKLKSIEEEKKRRENQEQTAQVDKGNKNDGKSSEVRDSGDVLVDAIESQFRFAPAPHPDAVATSARPDAVIGIENSALPLLHGWQCASEICSDASTAFSSSSSSSSSRAFTSPADNTSTNIGEWLVSQKSVVAVTDRQVHLADENRTRTRQSELLPSAVALRSGRLGKKCKSSDVPSDTVLVPPLSSSQLPFCDSKDRAAQTIKPGSVLNVGMRVSTIAVQPATRGCWLAIGGAELGSALSSMNADSTPLEGLRKLGVPLRGSNLIQLWYIPDMEVTSSTKVIEPSTAEPTAAATSLPHLVYAIAHYGGRVKELKWAPLGPTPPMAAIGTISVISQRMGVLAAIASDGWLRIFVPPVSLLPGTRERSSPLTTPVVTLEPIAVAAPPQGSCLECMNWRPPPFSEYYDTDSGVLQLAAGASDGTVMLWNLEHAGPPGPLVTARGEDSQVIVSPSLLSRVTGGSTPHGIGGAGGNSVLLRPARVLVSYTTNRSLPSSSVVRAIEWAVDGEELAGSADGCGAFDCCMGDEDAGQDKRATSSKRKWKGTTGGVLATLDNTGWLRVWHLQGISWEPVLEGPHTASNVVRTLWNSHLQWLADCTGLLMACGSLGSTFLQRWDKKGSEISRHAMNPVDSVASLRLVPDGAGRQIIFTGSTNGSLLGCSLDKSSHKILKKRHSRPPLWACLMHWLRPVPYETAELITTGDKSLISATTAATGSSSSSSSSSDGDSGDTASISDGTQHIPTFDYNTSPNFVDMRKIQDVGLASGFGEPIAAITAICCLQRSLSRGLCNKKQDKNDPQEQRVAPSNASEHAEAAASCQPVALFSASAAGIVRCQAITDQLRESLAMGLRL